MLLPIGATASRRGEILYTLNISVPALSGQARRRVEEQPALVVKISEISPYRSPEDVLGWLLRLLSALHRDHLRDVGVDLVTALSAIVGELRVPRARK